MSDDEWENDWNLNSLTISNENKNNNFVDIQSQLKLLENREMEEKADNILMNELFSNNVFKIEKDTTNITNTIKNNNNSSSKNENVKNKNNNKKMNDNKVKNYYKNKEFNNNKKKDLIKIKNDKKIINNNKKDIFGDYDDDNLDICCSIEDKYIK